MFDLVKEIYYVSWSDIRFMRHNILNVVLSSLVSPLLYLAAFGLGLGDTTISTAHGDIPYIAFMIPGIISLSSLSSSFSSTATRLNVQKLYYRSFDEMLMCPLRYSSIIMGKSILGVIRGLMSCTVIFILGLACTPEMIFTPMLLAVILLSCFTYSNLGVTAALLAKSHQSMALFNTLVITPMTFLCGTFFSFTAVPTFVKWILYCIPLTHTSECVRASALGWDFPWGSMAVLIAFAMVFFIYNVWLLKARKV